MESEISTEAKIRCDIEYLTNKIESFKAIEKQAASPYSMVGLTLDFANVGDEKRTTFCVSTTEMRFILNYLISNWKNERVVLEAALELNY